MRSKIASKIAMPVLTVFASILFGTPIEVSAQTLGTNGKIAFGSERPAGPFSDLDTTFSFDGKLTDWLSRGDDFASGVAVQPDGKIVIVGTSWTGASYDFAVARYNAAGSLE